MHYQAVPLLPGCAGVRPRPLLYLRGRPVRCVEDILQERHGKKDLVQSRPNFCSRKKKYDFRKEEEKNIDPWSIPPLMDFSFGTGNINIAEKVKIDNSA